MRIYVKVIPRSSKNEIIEISKGEYRAKITAPPEKGKANKMLIEMLAGYFNVPKSYVVIVGGQTAKIKIIDISDQI